MTEKTSPHTDAGFMTPAEVCERWKGVIHPSTMNNWRVNGQGPHFTKVRGKVLYHIDDVLSFEAKNKRYGNERAGTGCRNV